MTDTKHIPGPWFIDPEEPLSITAADGDNHPWLVARAVWFCGHEEETAPANARLISAAPDLLAALEAVLSSLKAYRKRNTRIAYDIAMQANSAEEAAIAAIAKARGQA